MFQKPKSVSMKNPFSLRHQPWFAGLLLSGAFYHGSMAMAQLPAFPGAEGFGSVAAGGRGGDVYYVTNLNASGAGSFAYGVQNAPTSGRTIIFAVSGHIRLPSGSGGGLTIDKSKITVAGQTAPGDGICFWNNTMNLSGNDLVLRHLRWRYGKQAAGGDSVDIANSQRIILDHCDVMFSTDENLSSFGTPPEFFTFQWSVNAWGLNSHSCGGLWDINHATAHHTLWANNHTRNPKCISPSVFDWANNVTFGWDNGFNMAASTDPIARVNIRGSYFIHGGNTTDAIYGGGLNSSGENIFKLHVSDSALDGTANGVIDSNRTNYGMVSSTSYDAISTPWPQTLNGASGASTIGIPVSLDARRLAHKKVLSQAGATRMEISTRPLRDELTQLCVDRTAALQRGIIADPLELGLSTGTAFADLKSTTAPLDSDLDGIPDDWEEAVGYNKAAANNNTVLTAPQLAASFFPVGSPVGYTQLEEYLHFKANPHGTVAKNTAVSPSYIDIDLRKFTSGFTSSPSFAVTGLINGTITQSGPGNAIVRFTPTVDASGRAGFNFTVTDAAGDSWTQPCYLIISTKTQPRPITWVGDGTINNWDTTATNFSSLQGNTAFANGDAVSIADTGSDSPPIKVIGALTPAALTVNNNSKNVTLQGSGSLSSSGSFVKTGSGTLTISNTGPNSFSSAAIEAGTVSLTTANALGTAPLSVSAGTVAFAMDLSNPLVVNGSVTLIPSGSRTYNGAWSGTGTIQINNSGNNLLSLVGSMSNFQGNVNFATSTGSARFYGNTGSASAAFDLGSGTLTLFTRNGGATFNLGSLTGASGTTLSGASSTTTVTTYTIGALGTSTTFDGRFTNGGQGATAITKIGSGTLTLKGNSTHTGSTVINAGEVALLGSFGSSPVSIAAGATLTGTGSLGGSLSVSAGAILSPGADNGDAAGTLTANSLTLTAPTLRFDLSSNPSSGNDRIQVNGALNLSGNQSFIFNLTNGILAPGTYELINCTGALSASAVTFSSNLPTNSRQTLTLEHSASGTAPGYVRLVVSGTNGNLIWTGSNGGLWDLQTTSAWSGASPATFSNYDNVTFNDSASSSSVSIRTAVAPQNVAVNNTTASAYVISGSAITGSTSLVKSGNGSLTLQLPQYTLANCSITSASAACTVSSTSNLLPGLTVTGTGIAAGTTILAIPSATTLTLSQSATATSSTASLTFETRHTYTGGTFLNGGTLILSSNATQTTGSILAPANSYGLGTGPITFNGGTLTLQGHSGSGSYYDILYGPLTNDLIVPAGQIGNINCTTHGINSAPFAALTGSLTGSGTLNLTTNYYRAGITGDWSAFAGIINVKRLASGAISPRFQIGATTGFPLATVNLEQTQLEYTDSSTAPAVINFGSLSGISSAIISGSQNATGPVTWRVGALNTSCTFAGSFTSFANGGPIGLAKTGTGTWTLTGSGTVSAGITVEQGTLSYGDAATDTLTGTSDISIESTATLQLNSGAKIIGASCEIFTGGTLRGFGTVQAPLDSSGTIAVAGGTLTITGSAAHSGSLEFSSLSDRLSITGDLALGGSVRLPTSGLSAGRKILVTYTGNLTLSDISFTNVSASYIPILDTSITGEIAVLLIDSSTYQTWQLSYFGNTTSPSAQPFADADDDGALNFEEFQAGTNPTIATSVLSLVWRGDASNLWDQATTANWLENTTVRVFRDKRNVSITDTGSNTPAITLSGSLQPGSLTVNNSTKVFTLSGSGSLDGTTGLTKSGSNALILTSAHGYTGVTAINGGILNLQNSSALGSATGATTVANNARLELQGNVTIADEPLTLSGSGGSAFYNGALNSKSGINTWTGPITLAAPGTRIGAEAGATLIVSGPISSASGTSGFIVRLNDATATVVLSGANRYAGDTTISGGVLKLGATDTLPIGTSLNFGLSGVAGKLDLNGFNQQIAGFGASSGTSNEITSTTPATLTVNATTSSTVAATLSGNLSLVKSGSATLTLASACSYTGATSIQSGTLLVDLSALTTPANLLNSLSPLTLAGTLEVKGKPATSSTQTLGNLTIPAGATATILISPNNATSANLTLGNTWTLGSGASLLIDLSAANASLTSNPALSGGLLPGVSVKDAIATGPATVVAGKVVRYIPPTLTTSSNDAAAEYSTLNSSYTGGILNWTNGGLLTNRSVQRLILDSSNSGGTIDMGAATNTLTLSSGEIQFRGSNNITLSGGQIGASGSAVALTTNATGTLTLGSPVSGAAGSLSLAGNATVILSSANTFTGGTTIAGGTLKLGNVNALGSANGPLTLNSGSLDLNGLSIGIGSLTGSGGSIVNSSSTAAMLTLGNNNATGGTFSGTIAGTIALSKSGSGTQILAAANSYTGLTTISAGTLRSAADQAIGNGDLTLSGGTLDLQSFSDTVNAVTLTSGTISGSTGLLTASSYALTSGTVSARIGGASAALTKSGSLYSNSVTLSGANSFGGATTLNSNSGSLIVAHNAALGTTSGVNVLGSGTALVLAHGVSIDSTPITIRGTGANNSSAGSFSGALTTATNATATWNGSITLGDSTARVGAGNNGTLNMTGSISGIGANQSIFFSSGSGTSLGTVVIAGSHNFSGSVSIIRGNLKLGAANTLPATAILDIASASVPENTSFDLNGFSQTLAGLKRTSTHATQLSSVTNSAIAPATLTLNQSSNLSYSGRFTGNLTVVKSGTGTLTLSRSDALATSLSLDLQGGAISLSTNQTITALRLNGVWQAAGTYTASNAAGRISGSGSLIVTTAGPSGFASWIEGFTNLSAAEKLSTADPDGDLASNFEEFAFGSDPTLARSANTRQLSLLDVDQDGKKDLVLTLALRCGASFSASGGDLVSAAVDGVIYRIEGSRDLLNFNSSVTEVTPARSSATLPTGYEWRSFRLLSTSSDPARGFLRASASTP